MLISHPTGGEPTAAGTRRGHQRTGGGEALLTLDVGPCVAALYEVQEWLGIWLGAGSPAMKFQEGRPCGVSESASHA